MALSGANRHALANARPLGIEDRFEQLQPYWAANCFIPTTNRYHDDTINRIEADLKPAGVFQQVDMADYVAASTLPHCLDGWSYLGRALSALLAGDAYSARHLGYYAELRAAMSLLAREGIGVFSERHFVVPDPAGGQICQALPNRSGTHEFVRDAFDYWAQSERATRLLCEVVRIGSRTLYDWLQAVGAPPATLSLLLRTNFIPQWGLDLAGFTTDHNTRKLFSYRPTAFHAEPTHPTNAMMSFVREIWTLSQPIGQSRFAYLDRFLLRRILTRYLDMAFGVTTANPVEFAKRIDVVIQTVGPTGVFAPQELRDFLCWNTHVAEPTLLFEASIIPPAGGTASVIQLISRAYLLLRLAAGASRELVDLVPALGLDPNDALAFWWRAVGDERGLWTVANPPPELSDLWDDVAPAIATLDNALNPHPPAGQRELHTTCPEILPTLSATERIGLWGVGL